MKGWLKRHFTKRRLKIRELWQMSAEEHKRKWLSRAEWESDDYYEGNFAVYFDGKPTGIIFWVLVKKSGEAKIILDCLTKEFHEKTARSWTIDHVLYEEYI